MRNAAAMRAEEPSDDALELTSRVSGADRDAQRDLVVRLLGRVRRTVTALLRSDPEADDAMQVSMLEILQAASSYRGEGSLERWADRIAVRTTLRLVRERRIHGAHVDDDANPAALPAPPADDAAITPRTVARCLEGLPEARRTCLVLRHVHGYSVEEIAELTNASPNTVKDRLLQGRAQLRKILRRDEIGRVP